jgi:concentrative nucleoside transporter, CNT family
MQQFQGLIGIVTLMAIAVLLSENRRRIVWRPVLVGLALQMLFAAFILKTSWGQPFFDACGGTINTLLGFCDRGTDFLFKHLSQLSSREQQLEGPLVNLAFRVLPSIIFFSAIMAVLYHLGVMQFIVRIIAWGMIKTMGTSGAETFSVAANIFVGQTEAPLLVQPFLARMTRSEIMAIMLAGFATIAGGVLALYVGMLKTLMPDIAGHLIASSVMGAPASIVFAKIMVPETETPETLGDLKVSLPRTTHNVIEAFGDGANEGLKLTLSVCAMLIAFIAAMEMVNALLGWGPVIPILGIKVPATSMQDLFGWVFRPLAWTLGCTWDESRVVGTLLGEKLVLTELIAYTDLSRPETMAQLSPRTARIAAYALCGFANFASVGIQVGGIGTMAPERKGVISQLAMKAMIGGALASAMTGAIAGLMI